MKMKKEVVTFFLRLLILFVIIFQLFGGIEAAKKSKISSSISGGKKKPLGSSSNIQKAKPYERVGKTWNKYYKDGNNLLPSNKMTSATKKGAKESISNVENKFPGMSDGRNLGGTNKDPYKVRIDHQGKTSTGKNNVQAQINRSHGKELGLSGKDKTSIGGVTGSDRFFAHNNGKTAAETMQQSIDANKVVSVHTSPIYSPPSSPEKRRGRSLLIGL